MKTGRRQAKPTGFFMRVCRMPAERLAKNAEQQNRL